MFSNEAITHAYCSSNLLEEKRYFDVLFISILVYFDKGRCFAKFCLDWFLHDRHDRDLRHEKAK